MWKLITVYLKLETQQNTEGGCGGVGLFIETYKDVNFFSDLNTFSYP